MLWKEAERQLAGVGDVSLGEWREVGEKAVHVKRRLSEGEQRMIGPVLDIRGSDEARQRAGRVAAWLHLAPPEILAEELAPR